MWVLVGVWFGGDGFSEVWSVVIFLGGGDEGVLKGVDGFFVSFFELGV